jgi:hypothetical protein
MWEHCSGHRLAPPTCAQLPNRYDVTFGGCRLEPREAFLSRGSQRPSHRQLSIRSVWACAAFLRADRGFVRRRSAQHRRLCAPLFRATYAYVRQCMSKTRQASGRT